MHFPIRARTSDNQRGDSFSVAGALVLEKRHCGGRGTGMRARCVAGTVNEVEIAVRRGAARAVKGRMFVEELQLSLGKYQRAQIKPTSKVVKSKVWCSIARYLYKVKPRAAATLHTSEPRCQAPHMNTCTPQHQPRLVETLAIV
jgi:molybdopterin-binding protein